MKTTFVKKRGQFRGSFSCIVTHY